MLNVGLMGSSRFNLGTLPRAFDQEVWTVPEPVIQIFSSMISKCIPRSVEEDLGQQPIWIILCVETRERALRIHFLIIEEQV